MSSGVFNGGRFDFPESESLMKKLIAAGIYEHHAEAKHIDGETVHDFFNFERLEEGSNMYILKELARVMTADIDDRINSVISSGDASNMVATAMSMQKDMNLTKVRYSEDGGSVMKIEGHQPSSKDSYVIVRDVYSNGYVSSHMKKILDERKANLAGMKSVIRSEGRFSNGQDMNTVFKVPFQYLFGSSELIGMYKRLNRA